MKYKPFLLSQIFPEIIKGEYHVSAELDKGTVPLISCKTLDHGVEGYFDIPKSKTYANCITIACDGMRPLTTFYHKNPISAKDNVLICIPNKEMKLSTIYYIIAFLNKSRWRFSYGRKFYYNKISKVDILLPVTNNNLIDEDAIEKMVKINYSGEGIERKNFNTNIKLKYFKLTDLGVTITRKYALYLNQLDPGKIPYVTTTETNNGISTFVDGSPNFKKNTLTVSLDGICGTTFYQFDDYISGEKTAVFESEEKNSQLLFYIGALVRLMSWKFHYGRKLSIRRLNELKIPVPIDKTNKVDIKAINQLVENSSGWNLIKKHII